MEYSLWTDIYFILYGNPKGEINKKTFTDKKEFFEFYYSIRDNYKFISRQEITVNTYITDED
jgi:hypothetical protein